MEAMVPVANTVALTFAVRIHSFGPHQGPSSIGFSIAVWTVFSFQIKSGGSKPIGNQSQGRPTETDCQLQSDCWWVDSLINRQNGRHSPRWASKLLCRNPIGDITRAPFYFIYSQWLTHRHSFWLTFLGGAIKKQLRWQQSATSHDKCPTLLRKSK